MRDYLTRFGKVTQQGYVIKLSRDGRYAHRYRERRQP